MYTPALNLCKIYNKYKNCIPIICKRETYKMLRSIVTSPKAEFRANSKVQYDFSQVFQNIPESNRDVNKRIQKYEECQSLSVKRAGDIGSC